MYNFTTNLYEMKREIVTFSKKISKGLNKPTSKFVMDMEYGLAKSGSCLISEISRSLDEKIKLSHIIERLCDNLANMYEDEKEIIRKNYLKEVKKTITSEEAIVLFDDSDINKEYSKKIEDLDRVIDASSQDNKTVNGYHVCEAVVLTKEEKQPISIYSKIYSCKSKNFRSKNNYTLESIETAEELFGHNFIGIFDRGYDDAKIITRMAINKFIIRLKDGRNLIVKGKIKSVEEIASTKKGKIKMTSYSSGNEALELSVSYSKVILPSNKKEYTLVIVYGLPNHKPMKLLTNIENCEKEAVIKIVRLYLSRWRIEEHFRGKKQEYDFENMRVRTLESMNNLNMLLTIHLGHIAMLAEKINKNLLSIKIIDASKSLKSKSIVWLSQMARGIKEILSYAHRGVKELQKIQRREKNVQLSLRLT